MDNIQINFSFTEKQLKNILMEAWTSGWLDYSLQHDDVKRGITLLISDVNKHQYINKIMAEIVQQIFENETKIN